MAAKKMELRKIGIVLAWLSGILSALMSSWAGAWCKMFFDELLGKDAPLPNLTAWFLAAAHWFWLVPICMGILLIAARKRRNIQDTVVLVSWTLSVLWLVYVIAAFLLPLMCITWRFGA